MVKYIEVSDNLLYYISEMAYEQIQRVPAEDVRPVVLCRDCKRYGGRPWENNETGICTRTDCGVGEDDFCSYGEKREES